MHDDMNEYLDCPFFHWNRQSNIVFGVRYFHCGNRTSTQAQSSILLYQPLFSSLRNKFASANRNPADGERAWRIFAEKSKANQIIIHSNFKQSIHTTFTQACAIYQCMNISNVTVWALLFSLGPGLESLLRMTISVIKGLFQLSTK